ncbi:hypothetical protein [Microbacterium awajiense]
MTNPTPVRLPVGTSTGSRVVPEWLDAKSSKIKAARKASAKATTDAATARQAVTDAKAALGAVSKITHEAGSPVYAPAPSSTTEEHDAARIAVTDAERAYRAATLAASRALDAFHRTASREARENAAVGEAVEARFAEVDVATAAAFAHARELLAERDELDKMLGVASVKVHGIRSILDAAKPGTLVRWRKLAEGHFDSASVLREAAAYFSTVNAREVSA